MEQDDNDRAYEIADIYGRKPFMPLPSSQTRPMDPKPHGKIKLGRQSHQPATVYVSHARVLTPEQQAERWAEEQRIREFYDRKRSETYAITGQNKPSKIRATPAITPPSGMSS